MEHYDIAKNMNKKEAYNTLGTIWFNGKGVNKNLDIAKKYYEKGIELEDGRAMENLAAIYEETFSMRSDRGDHIPDIDLAINLYERAAAQGIESANTHLAILYEKYG